MKKSKIDSELLGAAKDCDDFARLIFAQIGRRDELRALHLEAGTKPDDLEDALLGITLDIDAGGT